MEPLKCHTLMRIANNISVAATQLIFPFPHEPLGREKKKGWLADTLAAPDIL